MDDLIRVRLLRSGRQIQVFWLLSITVLARIFKLVEILNPLQRFLFLHSIKLFQRMLVLLDGIL